MKKFLFLPLLLWSMLALSQAVLPPKTLTDASFQTVTPSANTALPATQPDGTNVNVLVGNLPYLTAGGTATVTGKNMSGLNNTFSHLQPATVDVDATHRWWTDALNTALGLKLTNITGLISGSGVAGGSGTSVDPYIINTGTGGGGGTVVHGYTDVSTASTIALDFDAANYKNIPAWNGNITFTGSNNANGSGKSYVVHLVKSTASDLTLSFNATNFITPHLLSYSLFCKPQASTTPRSFLVKAPVNTELLLIFDMLPGEPSITITNRPDTDYPTVQRANILNLKNFPVMADPGATQAETVMYTYMLAGNTLSDTSTLTIPYNITTASGGTVQFKIRICPSASTTLSTCPTMDDYGINGTGTFRREAILTNINSLSSQSVHTGYAEFLSPTPESVRSIDFSQNQWIKFTVEKQGSTSQTGKIGRIRINGEGL